MTTIEQQPQTQSRKASIQAGDDQQQRQSQQQNSDFSNNSDRQQSAQEESFTISADDFMMA